MAVEFGGLSGNPLAWFSYGDGTVTGWSTSECERMKGGTCSDGEAPGGIREGEDFCHEDLDAACGSCMCAFSATGVFLESDSIANMSSERAKWRSFGLGDACM